MQPQDVSGSDFFLSEFTPRKLSISADLSHDLSACIYPVQGIAQVFSEPSNLDPHTPCLRNQTQFVTILSCDPEPVITKPTSRNIFLSARLDPDLSSGIYYSQ